MNHNIFKIKNNTGTDELIYNSLLTKKKYARSIDDFIQLAQEFRSFGSYKNSEILADECDEAAESIERKLEYRKLLRNRRNATSSDDFFQLAQGFCSLGDYKDSAILANECESIAEKKRQEEESFAEKERQKEPLRIELYKLKQLQKEYEEKKRKEEQSILWEKQGKCKWCGEKLSFWGRNCKRFGNYGCITPRFWIPLKEIEKQLDEISKKIWELERRHKEIG